MDIAIIGAGVSGAYAAWKLSKKYPGKSIKVYESNSRVGGRAYSVPIPGVKDFVVDLGAMRFRPEYDPKTWEVIQQLNLEVRNFSTPSTCEFNQWFILVSGELSVFVCLNNYSKSTESKVLVASF